jgi:hypothetical protein
MRKPIRGFLDSYGGTGEKAQDIRLYVSILNKTWDGSLQAIFY